MEVVGESGGRGVGFEAMDPLSFDMDDAVNILEDAFDNKIGFFSNYKAAFFKKVWRNDRVSDAGFIFDADENKSFRCAGPLTANDVAANFQAGAIFGVREIGGAPDILKAGAQNRHRMAAGGEVHPFV